MLKTSCQSLASEYIEIALFLSFSTQTCANLDKKFFGHFAGMSDTWTEIQEHKRRQGSLRDHLSRRRQERKGLSVQDTDTLGW